MTLITLAIPNFRTGETRRVLADRGREVIPAFRFIMSEMAKLDAKTPGIFGMFFRVGGFSPTFSTQKKDLRLRRFWRPKLVSGELVPKRSLTITATTARLS